ncbi:MAG: CHASE2 domain-containing protein [Cyclobacteriaceae bacterium]
MFRKLWLDAIFGTIFVFGLMAFFNSMTAFKIFDVFDPIGEALGDMETTDIVFSQLRDDPVADDRVVLVNMGIRSRAEIGYMLQIINQYNPAVIGVDSFFYFPKEDTLGDMILAESLAQVENLVMATKLIPHPTNPEEDSVATSWPMFQGLADDVAFVNLITDATEQSDLKMCRTFIPKIDIGGEEQIAFSVKLASYFDKEKAEKFLERKNEEEIINYRGNVIDYGATKFGNKYFALDTEDVFNENFTPDMITGKVVMFCYLGKYLGDRESLEDKFYTPLNEKYIGRAFPDMFGGVVHANIITMILNEDYINTISETQSTAIGIILAFLNVTLFSLIYKKIPKWYDGITKLFQLAEIGAFTFLILYLLDVYSFKLEMGLALVAIGVSGDALEVYYGVVKNSFTREGRRSLFKMDKL